MSFRNGMGERESIASELSETVLFGDLKRIKAAQTPYKRIQTAQESFYFVPFGRSSELFGFVKVVSPKNIVIRYRVSEKTKQKKVGNLYEAKRFLVQNFVV
jgi:hypothetical protein